MSMANTYYKEVNKFVPQVITLELLQTKFSKRLTEAATDLGIGSTSLKRICRENGIARWPRRYLKSKQNKDRREFHKLLTDALKEAQKLQNPEIRIKTRNCSSKNLCDSSFGDDEVAEGKESVQRQGSANKREVLVTDLAQNDGNKSFGNLFTIGSTRVPIISGGRKYGVLQVGSGMKTGQNLDLFTDEEQQLLRPLLLECPRV